MKFEYRKSEKQQELSNNSALTLKYSKFFKQNPDLIEFMRVILYFHSISKDSKQEWWEEPKGGRWKCAACVKPNWLAEQT
jgi:hypothetical protein